MRREDKRENRSKSREKGKEVFEKCIACRCKKCIKRREKEDEVSVNLCEGFEVNEEFS